MLVIGVAVQAQQINDLITAVRPNTKMSRRKIPPAQRDAEISDAMRRTTTQTSSPTQNASSDAQNNTQPNSGPNIPAKILLRDSQLHILPEPTSAKRRKTATPNGVNSEKSSTAKAPLSLSSSNEIYEEEGIADDPTSTRQAKRRRIEETSQPRRSGRTSKAPKIALSVSAASSSSNRPSSASRPTAYITARTDDDSIMLEDTPTSGTDSNSNLSSGPIAAMMAPSPYPMMVSVPTNFSQSMYAMPNVNYGMPGATHGPTPLMMMPFQPMMGSHYTESPYDFSHLPPVAAQNGQELNIIPSTRKGQKVKGRPPRKVVPTPNVPPPSVPEDDTPVEEDVVPAPTPRTTGNTHPRKQPFKAQVMFPGYPSGDTPIPAEFSLYEICQKLPNSLCESNLKAFVQWEWSGNELFACLPKDVRDILNARPGKDKTMIFQKRLERVRKDLDAKDEYLLLLAAPKERQEGRPNHIKCGNIRRR